MLIYWVINNNTNKDTDINNDNNNYNDNSNNNKKKKNVISFEFDLCALHSHIYRKNNKNRFVVKFGACSCKHLCL